MYEASFRRQLYVGRGLDDFLFECCYYSKKKQTTDLLVIVCWSI